MSTLPEGNKRLPREGTGKGIAAETHAILLPCVGNKGEYPYYCHRGDALSAGFSELRKDEKKSRRWILTAFLFSST